MTYQPPYPNQQPHYPPPPRPPARQKKPMGQGAIALIVLAVVVPIVALCTLGAIFGVNNNPSTDTAAATVTPSTAGPTTTSVPTDSPTTPPSASATPSPTGPATSFTDGTYLAGRDFVAGTYRSAGPADGYPSCYWARESNASGELDAIIANGDPTGPAEVSVNPGEYFETSFCQTWTRVG